MPSGAADKRVGMVVIGRNEGERFRRCVESLKVYDVPKVYVDSGSTDDSVAVAQEAGFLVVELDMSRPFTAGRARNEGFSCLLKSYPELDFVQFMDGDCTLCSGWVEAAARKLTVDVDLAIVCGRRKELYPEATIYNQLCDIEWNTPVGEADACGGDFLVRVSAFKLVNGFSEQVIAGEEPEMCFRLRTMGLRIERIDADMTWHDAAMTTFYEYWMRAKRSGHAYAQGVQMYGRTPEKFQIREVASILAWGVCFPVVVLVSAFLLPLLSFLMLLAYGTMIIKIARYRLRESPALGMRVAIFYSLFIMVGKFAQATGILKFVNTATRKKSFEIIEYK